MLANGETSLVNAQTKTLDESITRASALFLDSLQSIAKDCEQKNLPKELAATESMIDIVQNRDPGRQYLFLPESAWSHSPDKTLSPDSAWMQKTRAARVEYAERLFEAAREHVTSGPGAPIWQLIHEVLFWNPDHAAARETLGHKGKPGEWEATSEKLRVRKSTHAHSVMNWPAGQWIEVTTGHFTISSMADEESTRQLAELAERWRWVWQQVFFDFWNSPDRLARTLDGTSPKRNTRRFEIVLFSNKESYVQQLQQRVPGIEHSTGYYSDQQKVSFFYASNDVAIARTWRHELTHQFFQESVKAKPGVFDEGYLWLGEGIAMYLESLQDFGSHVTLGGFDASRLQHSRIRKLREGFYVSLAEISPISLATFQARPDLRNLYSQSAGITQMLMTVEHGQYRDGLIGFLGLLYAGRVNDDAFSKQVGLDFEQIEQGYDNFLKVDGAQVRKFLLQPLATTELALQNCDLDQEAYSAIGRCKNLIWLDVSGGEVTTEKIEQLADCDRLKQIFLSRATIRARSLASLGQLESLEELDLSGSDISDATLADLPALRNLTSLSIVSTRITDNSIPVILRLPALTSIGLRDSIVTEAGIRKIQSAKPTLTVR